MTSLLLSSLDTTVSLLELFVHSYSTTARTVNVLNNQSPIHKYHRVRMSKSFTNPAKLPPLWVRLPRSAGDRRRDELGQVRHHRGRVARRRPWRARVIGHGRALPRSFELVGSARREGTRDSACTILGRGAVAASADARQRARA